MEQKRPRGRPRKYKTRAALLRAKCRWAREWRLANPERWKEIQRKSDKKRRARPKLSILEFPSLELGKVKSRAKVKLH